MHVANAASSDSAASFCHFANTGNKRSGAARRVGETLWGWKGRGKEERQREKGSAEGLRKKREDEENWTRQRKERKDRILEGGARKGENFKEGEEGRGKEMRE